MFSYDFIVVFFGFCTSLIVLGLSVAQRRSYPPRRYWNFLAINSIYSLYLLIVLVLNYVKFASSYENAFWLTTEVWCLGTASISLLAWRIPHLISTFRVEQLSHRTRMALTVGLAVSVLMVLFGYFFLQDSDYFELATSAGPAFFFVLSLIGTFYSIIKMMTAGSSIRSYLFLLLPVVLLLVSITIDALLYIFPFTLYPYSILYFQIAFLIALRPAVKQEYTEELRAFLQDLAQTRGTSKRENELVALLLEGMSRQQIADRLHISHNTVKTHTANIYRKINITSRNQLFALFYQQNTAKG